jgi:hypothetical protein
MSDRSKAQANLQRDPSVKDAASGPSMIGDVVVASRTISLRFQL